MEGRVGFGCIITFEGKLFKQVRKFSSRENEKSIIIFINQTKLVIAMQSWSRNTHFASGYQHFRGQW